MSQSSQAFSGGPGSAEVPDEADPIADLAERIAGLLEEHGDFRSVDWADLGDVTVRTGGRTYRMTIEDITDGEEGL